MCIIAYAPKGAKIQEDTIKTMFDSNPDGAGIMWKPTDSSAVEIRKGFFKVEELIKAFKKIPVDCEKAIHCRIATAGKISVACCHPFPVRQQTNAMTKASDQADIALMHNGVVDYCNPTKGLKSKVSDSMMFARDILYPLAKMLDRYEVRTLIENSSNSRFLIMRKCADTIMLGNWKYADGVYYSNDSYKPFEDRFSYFYGTHGGCNYSFLNDCSGTKSIPKKNKKSSTVETVKNILADEYVDRLNTEAEHDSYRYWIDVNLNSCTDDDAREEATLHVLEEIEETGAFINDYWFEHRSIGDYIVLSLDVESANPIRLDIDNIAGFPVDYISKA